MKEFRTTFIYLLVLTAALFIMTACTTAADSGQVDGQLAFPDDVAVVERMEHSYANVRGHYPDACSRISDVQQSVEGSSINIVLYVDRPADMMCAQMLTPFEVDILLETGGLAPGEYTVTVNEARTATFMIGG